MLQRDSATGGVSIRHTSKLMIVGLRAFHHRELAVLH